MVFILFILSYSGNFSVLEGSLFSSNDLLYQGAMVRESQMELLPMFIHLKEVQFFKSNGVPYHLFTFLEGGFRFRKENLIISIFYDHTCNNGINTEPLDKRQWNRIGASLEIKRGNFLFDNSFGYVVSPFGPPKLYNNYKWILTQNLRIKKELFGLKFFTDLNILTTFSPSMRSSILFRVGIFKDNLFFGGGTWRWYGLKGELNRAHRFQEVYSGWIEKSPIISTYYAYFLKSPSFGFLSHALIQYPFKMVSLITEVNTVSPPKRQYPRFVDYRLAFEFNLPFQTKLLIHTRSRLDGNTNDFKDEAISGVGFKKLYSNWTFFINIPLKRENYPYLFSQGISLRYSPFVREMPLNGRWNIEGSLSFFAGKRSAFSFDIKSELEFKKKLGIFLMERFRPVGFEDYGIVQHLIGISLKSS